MGLSTPARSATARSALDNNANKVTPPLTWEESSARTRRYGRRALLWGETRIPRLAKCGRVMHADTVAVRHREGSGAGFAGLTTCGSVWLCPVCNAKVMARRALEIGSAVALSERLGWRAGFFTFTMRHRKGQRLDDLWDGLAEAWKSVIRGEPWQRIKRRFGVAGFIRVAEVTWGVNGWHVHLHVIVLFSGEADVSGLMGKMFPRWQRALVRRGLEAPLLAGQDAQLLDGPGSDKITQYVTKAQDHGKVTKRGQKIGLELTGSQLKKARAHHSTRPTWDLLDDWFSDGDADAAALWGEFERASKGRRQISWSRGLRDALGMGKERKDEDIAAEELGSAEDDLVHITKDGWRQVLAFSDLIPQLLNTTEKAGLSGLRALLDEYRIDYSLPEDQNDGSDQGRTAERTADARGGAGDRLRVDVHEHAHAH